MINPQNKNIKTLDQTLIHFCSITYFVKPVSVYKSYYRKYLNTENTCKSF